MTTQEAKNQIRSNIRLETVEPPKSGGQSVGVLYSKQRLYSEELDFSVETGFHRSAEKNRALLLTLFDLVLDELVY